MASSLRRKSTPVVTVRLSQQYCVYSVVYSNYQYCNANRPFDSVLKSLSHLRVTVSRSSTITSRGNLAGHIVIQTKDALFQKSQYSPQSVEQSVLYPDSRTLVLVVVRLRVRVTWTYTCSTCSSIQSHLSHTQSLPCQCHCQ